MKINKNRVLVTRVQKKSISTIFRNNERTNCNVSEHISVEVTVEGCSYNIQISNQKINEVFVKAFPHL